MEQAMPRKDDPYNRIMKAAKYGAGVMLSREEVRALSFDDAIETRAAEIANDRSLWRDQVKMFGTQQ
jgi:hypothetical protein